jgi:hypothetical protein
MGETEQHVALFILIFIFLMGVVAPNMVIILKWVFRKLERR